MTEREVFPLSNEPQSDTASTVLGPEAKESREKIEGSVDCGWPQLLDGMVCERGCFIGFKGGE